MKYSTALRNHLLGVGSLKAALDGGVIRIYSGTIPASADDATAPGAALLCEITVDDDGVTGLTLEAAAANGSILKNASETWQGTATANELATFFRWESIADDGSSSTTLKRIQGTIAQGGADMNMGNPLFTNGAVQTIDYFIITQPV